MTSDNTLKIHQHSALTVNRLTVRRGQQPTLQDISVSLEAGTDVTIIGPNGAGKGTLVQSILGIMPREAGTIELMGQSIGGKKGATPASIRHQVAYLPQTALFSESALPSW